MSYVKPVLVNVSPNSVLLKLIRKLKAEQLSSSVKVEVPALHCVVKVSTRQYCLAGL